MIIGKVVSKNRVTIRLTEERWLHIISSHREIDPTEFLEVLDTVENPDAILKGDVDELLAVRKRPRKQNWLVVVYKETLLLRNKEASQKDGFILTAYVTTDARWLFKRKVIWKRQLPK